MGAAGQGARNAPLLPLRVPSGSDPLRKDPLRSSLPLFPAAARTRPYAGGSGPLCSEGSGLPGGLRLAVLSVQVLGAPVVVPSLRSAAPKGRGERARAARGPAHLGAVIGSRPGRAAADFPSLRGLRSRFGSLKGIGFSVHICSGALVKCDLKRIFSSLIVFVLFFLKRIFCP